MRGTLASLCLAAAVVAVLAVPGTASASKVNCAGKIAKSAERPGSKKAAEYSFVCDAPVLAYSVTFNRQIGVFDPEVLPLLPSGEASGELVSCEGNFPGPGIGCTAQSAKCPSATSPYTECTGTVAAGNTSTSEFDTTKAYCAKKRPKYGPLTAYLVVSTVETTATGRTFVNSSHPIKLNNELGCPKPPKKGG